MHYVIAFLFWITFNVVLKVKNGKNIAYIVFLYTLFISVLLRIIHWKFTGVPYGDFGILDTYTYERNAMRFIGRPFSEIFHSLVNLGGMGKDDMGFSFYMCAWFDLIRDADIVRWLLLLLNSSFIAYSVHLIFKIGTLLKLNVQTSRIVAGFYGLFPFFAVSSAMGLKENLFCLIIVIALYNIFKYKEQHRILTLLNSIFFIVCAYFFRSAISLMLIIVLILTNISNESNKKKMLIVMASMTILMIFSLVTIISKISDVSLELVTSVAEYRMNSSGITGSIGWLIQGLATIIGPFPNFSRSVQYAMYFSSGLTTKIIFSVFVISALITVIKKYDWKFYSISAYLVMGYIMLLISGTSLDMRYHITFFPAFCLLLGYGLDRCHLKKERLYALCPIITTIALLYNFR